jgi:hypothetical protein
MKKRWKLTAIVVTAAVITLAVAGVVLAQGSWWNDSSNAGDGRGQGNGAGGQIVTTTSAVTSASTAPSASTAAEFHADLVIPTEGALSQAETDSLIFLREEEKLARDVYQALYAEWGTKVFTNIASSEAKHMDSVKTLLDAYGLTDPVTQDTPGVFVNAELQAAYDSLVAQGSQSLEEAFKVGVAIENLDIEDLQTLISATTHPDITEIAQNLLKGSQNHLSAFTRQLER